MTVAQGIPLFQEILEEVPCPLCGADQPVHVLAARDVLFWRPGTYNIVRCSLCSMRYVSPRPSLADLSAHYPDNYFIYVKREQIPAWVLPIADWLSDSGNMSELRRIERVIGRVTPSTRIVDVGCGMNHFLALVHKRRGCMGVGVDFKAEAAAYVRDVRKMPCLTGTLHDAKFADASFDLVTMFQYLEHEPTPLAVLQEARRITRPGGHISIEVPLSDSLPARVLGSRWGQIDAPRHLVHFTKRTLADMVGRSGFEVVQVGTFQIPFVLGFSITQALGARIVGGPTIFDASLALLASLPFWLLLYPWLDEFVHVLARAV